MSLSSMGVNQSSQKSKERPYCHKFICTISKKKQTKTKNYTALFSQSTEPLNIMRVSLVQKDGNQYHLKKKNRDYSKKDYHRDHCISIEIPRENS